MSNRKLSKEYIHYGCSLSLSLQENTFMHSSGFIDTSVYLAPVSSVTDYSDCIFRVLPLCIHSVQNTLLSSLKESLQAYQSKYIKLAENLEGEIKLNLEGYQKTKGEPVRFGSIVYLQHIQSHKFLSVLPNQTALSDKDSFKVALIDFPNDYSYIKIQPSYNFQKEGNGFIRIDDIVILEILLPSLNKPVFITTSNSSLKNQELKEINASLDSKFKWQINFYLETPIENNNLIRSGDYVWISHSEIGVVLVGAKDKTIYFNNNITDCNGLWQIEKIDNKQGGYIYSEKQYRLKHLSSGLYLSVELNEDSFIGTLGQSDDLYTIWVFEQIYAYKKKSKLFSDQFCSLVNLNTGVRLQGLDYVDQVFYIKVGFSKDSSEASYFKIFKAEDTFIWESKFILSSISILKQLPEFILYYSSKSDEDPYTSIKNFHKKVKTIDACLEHINSFLLNKQHSSVTIGKYYGYIDKTRQKSFKELGIMDILSQTLEKTFIGEFSLKKVSQVSKKIIKTRSHLKDREKIDIKKDLSFIQVSELINIVHKIYKVLTTACKDNLENQKYAQKYFPVYQKHAGYGLGATSLISSIIKNNENLLLSLEKETIGLYKKNRTNPKAIGLYNNISIIQHYVWLLRVFYI
jgi:Inositol 1,4,5-trisphosphate/ryanodine receptor/MIR domain/RIH domain